MCTCVESVHNVCTSSSVFAALDWTATVQAAPCTAGGGRGCQVRGHRWSDRGNGLIQCGSTANRAAVFALARQADHSARSGKIINPGAAPSARRAPAEPRVGNPLQSAEEQRAYAGLGRRPRGAWVGRALTN